MSQEKKADLTFDQLEVGGKYNWKWQEERLEYIGKEGNWNQFIKVGDKDRVVWCEVLDSDLHMMEETVE